MSVENSADKPKYVSVITHSHGFAIGDGAQVVLGGESPTAVVPPPKITLTLLTHTFPTAYCHQLNASEFPFVTVTLDNRDATLIGGRDFATAQKVGQQQYEKALLQGFFDRELFDGAGFARLIDVAACRKHMIYPLE